jgi:hypothetical protein
MNHTEASKVATELTDFVRCKMEEATGEKYAVVISFIQLSVAGEVEGTYTSASFKPTAASLLPVFEGLLVAITQEEPHATH